MLLPQLLARPGAMQASSLSTSEVKSAWISPGGPTILSALNLPDSIPAVAILGMTIAGVAVLGLAFLTRRVGKSEDNTSDETSTKGRRKKPSRCCWHPNPAALRPAWSAILLGTPRDKTVIFSSNALL